MSLYVFFFFKQKTAYEMRISDWSSDVCSSDLGSKVYGRYVFHPTRRRRQDRGLAPRGRRPSEAPCENRSMEQAGRQLVAAPLRKPCRLEATATAGDNA